MVTLLAIPVSLATTLTFTPSLRASLRALNPRPMPPGFRILAQRRGPTGLVSVVDKPDSHRMLIADLSVLGGYHQVPGYVPDSIFSQFYVHEAVRLTRRPGDSSSAVTNSGNGGGRRSSTKSESGGRNGRTLCIGVGVGVVTRALRTLGCEVDAVELDDAVAAFAKRWFSLTGSVRVADARDVLHEAIESASLTAGAGTKGADKRYDYIVHDAFTGGGMSTGLVSERELGRLRQALRDDGVLVMNVVAYGRGRVVAAVVFDRLVRVFGHVRMFSEQGAAGRRTDGHEERDKDGLDNVVVFASAVPERVQFRKPRLEDMLESQMRAERLQEFEKGEIDRGTLGTRWDSWWAEEMALQLGMCEVGWHHAKLMKVVHAASLWPAVLAAEAQH